MNLFFKKEAEKLLVISRYKLPVVKKEKKLIICGHSRNWEVLLPLKLFSRTPNPYPYTLRYLTEDGFDYVFMK